MIYKSKQPIAFYPKVVYCFKKLDVIKLIIDAICGTKFVLLKKMSKYTNIGKYKC